MFGILEWNGSFPSVLGFLQKVQGISGVVSAEPVGSVTQQFYPYNGSIPNIKAIQDNSVLFQHLALVSGRKTLHANESVINAGSQYAQNYKPGETVKYSLGQSGRKYNVTLTVVGEVQLDATAVNTLGVSPYYYTPSGSSSLPASTLITSWDQTFAPIVDWFYSQTGFKDYSIMASVNVYLDRAKLLSAFNVESSITQVQQIDDQVSNIAALNGFSSNSNLVYPLQQFSSSIFALRLEFTIFSIPVFFVSWFVGRTVSQASFNLRRREIGLLMTKGFSQTQLFRHFLVEALLVGLIGGGLGLAATVLLNPVFFQMLSWRYSNPNFLSQRNPLRPTVLHPPLPPTGNFFPPRAASCVVH